MEEPVQGLPLEEPLQGLPMEEPPQRLPRWEPLPGLSKEEPVQGLPMDKLLLGLPTEGLLACLLAADKILVQRTRSWCGRNIPIRWGMFVGQCKPDLWKFGLFLEIVCGKVANQSGGRIELS